MLRYILTHLGHRVLKETGASRALDWKLGLRLFRDGRVPASTKALAVGLGVAALAVLQVMELPIESALALLVPVLGFAGDIAIEGVEILAVPFFAATLLLPFLAPREVVELARGEADGMPQTAPIPDAAPPRKGFFGGRIYDASGAVIR